MPKSLLLNSYKPQTYKEAPTQMFSIEFCEIFKNIYFGEYLQTADFRL